MARAKTPSTADELAALRQSIDNLAGLLQTLVHAVDELTVELQWRNNDLRGSRGNSPPPHVVLHSMPLDPCSKDWQINRVQPEPPAGPQPAPAKQRPQTLFD